jgi:predicted RNA-binding Zn-ribbon protein involved in translation (DUF1610 family)
MITVACPACKIPMGIEANEPNTEWECPTCGVAILARINSKGQHHFTITEAAALTPSSADETTITVACPSCKNSDGDRRQRTRNFAGGVDVTNEICAAMAPSHRRKR